MGSRVSVWLCCILGLAVGCGDSGEEGASEQASAFAPAAMGDGDGMMPPSGDGDDAMPMAGGNAPGPAAPAPSQEGELTMSDAPILPTVTGTCPDLQDGMLMFAPEGVSPREVRIFMSEAARTMDGPLIFYWHGWTSRPAEAMAGLSGVLEDILAQGGIVAAPSSDPESGTFPWFEMVSSNRPDDWLVADEVLACAIEQVGVDESRIHAMGMSAGGLNTSQMMFRRNNYLASVAIYSGGLNANANPPRQSGTNMPPALMFYGGPMDMVVINFQDTTMNLDARLNERGNEHWVCNHNNKHTIPTDAIPSVWQFLQDHPFGTRPSPYADGLPDTFPDYCE